MSVEQIQSPTVPPLRFGLRAMLVLTAAAVVVAAIIGALFRKISDASQSALLTEWGVTLAFALIVAARRYQLYLRGICHAGPVWFILRPRAPLLDLCRRPPIFWIVLGLSLASVYGASIERALAGRSEAPSETFFKALLIAPLLCIACYFLLCHLSKVFPVRLCEEGLRAGGEFKDWRLVSLARWDQNCQNALLISMWTERTGYDLLVPPALRDEVEQFLSMKTCFVRDLAQPQP